MAIRTIRSSPIGSLTRALQQCRIERKQIRSYAAGGMDVFEQETFNPVIAQKPAKEDTQDIQAEQNDIEPIWTGHIPEPTPGFRFSQTTRQNRFEPGKKVITCYPKTRSTIKMCKDPIAKITQEQLAVLDPTGARQKLFAYDNPDRVKVGDVVLVRLKSGDPFAGVILNIRQSHSKIDWAILLRNHLTRVGVEMWFKIFSPNVEGIEIVQRKLKRARRNKLYYMRQPKHDMGSLEGVVRNYTLAKAGLVASKKGKKVARKR